MPNKGVKSPLLRGDSAHDTNVAGMVRAAAVFVKVMVTYYHMTVLCEMRPNPIAAANMRVFQEKVTAR